MTLLKLAIVQQQFMKSSRKKLAQGFRSMLKIAFTAKPVISKILAKILYGRHPRAAVVLITSICRKRKLLFHKLEDRLASFKKSRWHSWIAQPPPKGQVAGSNPARDASIINKL